jgi:GAG-pre-integrase domain
MRPLRRWSNKRSDKATLVVRSTLVVPAAPAREDRECYNCGKKGDLSYNCLQSRNTGGTRGGRGQRGGRGGQGGIGRGGRGVAHLAVADDSYNTTEANTAEMTKLEELRRFKLQVERSKGNLDDTAIHFGNFAGYAHVNKSIQALTSTKTHVDWIIDSGAFRHITGTSSEFVEYHPSKHVCPETIQTADGTSQPISGIGSVRYNPTITLSSVLHVPSFPFNLLSVSPLVDQLNCTVLFDKNVCIFYERKTGRKIGTGVRRDGLWYVDREIVLFAIDVNEGHEEVMLQHHRLRHLSFDSLNKFEPELMNKVDRQKFFCDACELGKQTRSTYRISGLRNMEPFVLVHSDVWGPCPTSYVSKFQWFVTFIDCHSRMTWIYMMKQKSKVYKCFQDFLAYVKTQFGAHVKVLRTENGT